MYISYDDFKNTPLYDDFIKKNPSVGTLKVYAYTADEAFPSKNTNIVVQKKIGDYTVLFYSGYTNESGVIDDIVLPAPNDIDKNVLEVPTYETYELNAFREGYLDLKINNIGMFGGVSVIQYLRMIPRDEINV